MTQSDIDLDRLADALADRIAIHLSNRPDVGERLLDVCGAAELLGCSVSTIERHTRTGRIPSKKIGGLRRYRQSDLLSFRE